MSNQGCLDANCKLRIGPRPKQHTNGGCKCLQDVPTKKRLEIERKLQRQRRLLKALHEWFLDQAPEKYKGCGLWIDVENEVSR